MVVDRKSILLADENLEITKAIVELLNKKLKSIRLRQLLQSNSRSTMDILSLKIESYYLDWKGDHEQIDDICVVGLEL